MLHSRKGVWKLFEDRSFIKVIEVAHEPVACVSATGSSSLGWSVLAFLEETDIVEYIGRCWEEDGARGQLDVERPSEDSVVDILAHVSEPDAVEPSSRTAKHYDLCTDEETRNEQHPGTCCVALYVSLLCVVQNNTYDGEEDQNHRKHSTKLANKKPYGSFQEFPRVIKTALWVGWRVTAAVRE